MRKRTDRERPFHERPVPTDSMAIHCQLQLLEVAVRTRLTSEQRGDVINIILRNLDEEREAAK